MNKELRDKLVEKYPTIFRHIVNKTSLSRSSMILGFECGDGWYQIIDDLCAAIMEQPDGKHVVAEQVKEKFGGLRFYISCASDADPTAVRDFTVIHKLIDDAEARSLTVCEWCGTTENVTTGGHRWIRSLCRECHEKSK